MVVLSRARYSWGARAGAAQLQMFTCISAWLECQETFKINVNGGQEYLKYYYYDYLSRKVFI